MVKKLERPATALFFEGWIWEWDAISVDSNAGGAAFSIDV
jgi:hypothetical protein